jgi:hypothetical protein
MEDFYSSIDKYLILQTRFIRQHGNICSTQKLLSMTNPSTEMAYESSIKALTETRSPEQLSMATTKAYGLSGAR